MRKNPTEAEAVLWKELKGKKTGFKFRQQHPIDEFIPDFVCLSRKLIVELDGKYHDFQVDKDDQRTLKLEQKFGYKVIRFTNEEVINDFLKIAVKNNLITEEERSEIKGYEILRGDRGSEKSIIARGITFDLYKYTEKGRDIHYANYPFNSLGDDIMHYKDKDRDNFISHPYNSQENSNWTFHSPDTDYNSQNASASYLVVDGYIYGKSEANIDIVKEHPKYTILGRD